MTAKDFYRVAGKQVNELTKPYGFKKNGRFFIGLQKKVWCSNSVCCGCMARLLYVSI